MGLPEHPDRQCMQIIDLMDEPPLLEIHRPFDTHKERFTLGLGIHALEHTDLGRGNRFRHRFGAARQIHETLADSRIAIIIRHKFPYRDHPATAAFKLLLGIHDILHFPRPLHTKSMASKNAQNKGWEEAREKAFSRRQTTLDGWFFYGMGEGPWIPGH